MLVEKKLRPSAVAATLRVVLVVVGAGPLWALTAQPSGPAVPMKETHFSRLALTDLLFTQDVLLEGRAMSRVDCCKKCVNTQDCVMTTFHPSPQGPPHHCRLYSTLHQATHPSRHVAGAKSFAADPSIVKYTTSADSPTETVQSCSRDKQSCQTTLTSDIPDEASTVPIQTTLTSDIPDEASTVPSQTTLTSDIPDEASTVPIQTTLTTDIPDEASTAPSQTTLTTDIPDEASTAPSQTTLTTYIPDEASTVPSQTTLTTDIPDEASTVPIQTTLTTDIPDEASTVPSQTTLTTDIPDEASTAPSTTDGPATTTSPPCRDSTSCTGEYTLKCGRCLHAGSLFDAKTYSGAKQQCSDNGGWLVMTKTLADLQCVRNFHYTQTRLTSPFWVGADDTKSRGQFTWNDGTPLPRNSDLWGMGQPPKALYTSGYQCVRDNGNFAKFNALSCSFRYVYICQKDCK